MLLLLFAAPGPVEPPAPPDTAPFWYGADFAGMPDAFVYGVLAGYVTGGTVGRSDNAVLVPADYRAVPVPINLRYVLVEPDATTMRVPLDASLSTVQSNV